jgi:nucleoside-diphosphate-sugar epimerase
MKIIIAGNLGYVGPCVTRRLRERFPDAELIGFDIGYFAHSLSSAAYLPEVELDRQVFGDIRSFPEQLLEGADAVVDLAAISNDPMGRQFEEITMEVNFRAAVRLAELSKRQGVKHFVFASSCSVYGAGGDRPRTEEDPVDPLTAYARSKVAAEQALQPLADDGFVVTCHRFATAAGFSKRVRLDLVLNDFVLGAITNRHIDILSDGTPWRPLIHPEDMARAIEWSVQRNAEPGGAFLAVNTGANNWNFQVRELADAVAAQVPGASVGVNASAPPDKRSYCVNFDRFRQLAPDHQPLWTLEETIRGLKENLERMVHNDSPFRSSQFIRLKVLEHHREQGRLNSNLEWIR